MLRNPILHLQPLGNGGDHDDNREHGRVMYETLLAGPQRSPYKTTLKIMS